MTITPDTLKNAVQILQRGGLVAFPTETVYGLGADARCEAALHRIFRVKERPYAHPLIVHVPSIDYLSQWAQAVSDDAMKLAHYFWPGPLTMILKRQPHVLDVVTGNQETVGIRIPQHPLAQALLNAFQGGIAAPSANKFTRISPTTAEAVQQELGAGVDLILDGGACEVGLESTIIDMSSNHPLVLRPGMITVESISAVLGKPVALSPQHAAGLPRAPGMHSLHYAPITKTMMIETEAIPALLQSLPQEERPAALLLRSSLLLAQQQHSAAWEQIHVVSMPQEAAVYAHHLYQTLRELDQQQFKHLIIEAVPETNEWRAVSDRLRKASAAR